MGLEIWIIIILRINKIIIVNLIVDKVIIVNLINKIIIIDKVIMIMWYIMIDLVIRSKALITINKCHIMVNIRIYIIVNSINYIDELLYQYLTFLNSFFFFKISVDIY